MDFDLFSFHVVQAKEVITLDAKSVHSMEGRFFPPRGNVGKCMNGMHIPQQSDDVQPFVFLPDTPVATLVIDSDTMTNP